MCVPPVGRVSNDTQRSTIQSVLARGSVGSTAMPLNAVVVSQSVSQSVPARGSVGSPPMTRNAVLVSQYRQAVASGRLQMRMRKQRNRGHAYWQAKGSLLMRLNHTQVDPTLLRAGTD